MPPDVQDTSDSGVGRAIRNAPVAFVMSDARLAGEPLTYVNDAFERMTLYGRDFALGRNCRFLQGPETDPADAELLREGLRSGREFQVTMTSHRADGSSFRNQILVSPIHDESGELTAHFAFLREVPWPEESEPDADSLALLRELQHRVKNHLAMVVSMIRLQASREVTADSLKGVSRRVEALGLLYEELLAAGGEGDERRIYADAYLGRIASVVASLQSRETIRLDVACEAIPLSLDQAARLGLLLSEFLTNALEHAFVGQQEGRVQVRLRRLEDGAMRLSVEDDGVGLPKESDWPYHAPSIETQQARAREDGGPLDTTAHDAEPGVGGSIVAALTRSLRADLSVVRLPRGTRVTVDFQPETGERSLAEGR
jgi:PAS domain S-box-containing protein